MRWRLGYHCTVVVIANLSKFELRSIYLTGTAKLNLPFPIVCLHSMSAEPFNFFQLFPQPLPLFSTRNYIWQSMYYHPLRMNGSESMEHVNALVPFCGCVLTRCPVNLLPVRSQIRPSIVSVDAVGIEYNCVFACIWNCDD